MPLQTFVKAHHKVGVLRVKEGQRNEEDIFCNCHESGPFDEFLNVLGAYIIYTYLSILEIRCQVFVWEQVSMLLPGCGDARFHCPRSPLVAS